MIWRKAISIKFFQSVNGTTWFPLTPMCFWNYSRELWRNDTFVVIFVKAITPSLTAPPHPSSLPHFSPLSSHLNLVTFLAYFHASILITTVQPEQVGAISSLGSHSKIPFIAAIVVGATLFLLLLVIAAILVRRRQIYGGFYICTTPPLPDMIPRLDSSIPLIEQVHKLPLDKRWEFPREHLRFCKI